jgi:hypothetical protein
MVFIRNIAILLYSLFMTYLTIKLAVLSVHYIHVLSAYIVDSLPEHAKKTGTTGLYISVFSAFVFLINPIIRFLKKYIKTIKLFFCKWRYFEGVLKLNSPSRFVVGELINNVLAENVYYKG